MSTTEITNATFSSVIMNIGADETKRNVTWYSDRKAAGEIRYAKASETTDGVFPEVYRRAPAIVSDTTKTGYYSYKVTMSGLEANTSYVYRLVTGASVSDIYTFDVKSFADEYTFVLVGDPQVSTWGGPSWSDTLQKIEKYFPETSFVISAGDQTSTPTSEENYDNFTVDEVAKTAVAITLGTSHDNAATFTTHYNLPNLSSTYGVSAISSDYYYTYNSTLFMHLNVESTNHESHAAFIRRTVANNPDCIWQVVIIHYAPYSGANYNSYAAFRERLSGVYAECGIDVVLSGHDHIYARSELMIDNLVASDDVITNGTVTDPKGVLYITAAPSTAAPNFSGCPNSTDYTARQDWTERKSIIAFDMTETSMTMTAYYVDGNEPEAFDTFTIYHTAETVRLNGNTDLLELSTDGGKTRIPLVSAYAYDAAAVRAVDGYWSVSEDGGASYTSLGIAAAAQSEGIVLILNTETGYWELSTDGGASFAALPISIRKYDVTFITDADASESINLSDYPTHTVAADELPDAPMLTLPQGSVSEGVLYEWAWNYYPVSGGDAVTEFSARGNYVAYLSKTDHHVSNTLYIAGKTNAAEGVYTWTDAWRIVKKFPKTEFALLVTEDLTLAPSDAASISIPVNLVIDLAGHTVDGTAANHLITLNTGADTSSIRIITSERNGICRADSVFYIHSGARSTLHLTVGGENSEPITVTGTYLINAGNNFKNASHLYLNVNEGTYELSCALLVVFNLRANYNHYYVTVHGARLSTGASPVEFRSTFCAHPTSILEATSSSFTHTGAAEMVPFFSADQWLGTAQLTDCKFDGITLDRAIETHSP